MRINPSPKGKKEVGRGTSPDHLCPKGLVGFTQGGGGPATTTTAPARYFLASYSGTPWPEMLRRSRRALSLETSSQFTQAGGGPTTTTTAPARYFLAIYSETSWPGERPPTLGTALSLETSSQFTHVSAGSAGRLSSPHGHGGVVRIQGTE